MLRVVVNAGEHINPKRYNNQYSALYAYVSVGVRVPRGARQLRVWARGRGRDGVSVTCDVNIQECLHACAARPRATVTFPSAQVISSKKFDTVAPDPSPRATSPRRLPGELARTPASTTRAAAL